MTNNDISSKDDDCKSIEKNESDKGLLSTNKSTAPPAENSNNDTSTDTGENQVPTSDEQPVREILQPDVIGKEVLKEIDSIEDPEERAKAFRAILISFSFRGPIPPPDFLDGYEKVLKGSANRILEMAEKEQENSIYCDQKSLTLQEKTMDYTKDDNDKNYSLANKIVFIGLGLYLVVIVTGLWLLWKGFDIAGYIVLGTTMIPLIYQIPKMLFDSRKFYNNNNKENKPYTKASED